MPDKLFQGLFSTAATAPIRPTDFLLCLGVSLVIGLMLALSYMFRTRYTKSFVVTLAILPGVVCVITMMVNGDIGTGVAILGVFSLVRFRSVPGTAKEIGALFIAMGAGLIVGMGYLGYAVLFAVIMCGVFVAYNLLRLGSGKNRSNQKVLTVTIPEDLNYTNVFADIFAEYTVYHELVRVKTTNMGSLFRLTYDVTFKSPDTEKEFIDKLRCRNGNLEISVSCQETVATEL